jgi:hypothetical protein
MAGKKADLSFLNEKTPSVPVVKPVAAAPVAEAAPRPVVAAESWKCRCDVLAHNAHA